MKVLIVAKTRMQKKRCVGGLTLDGLRNVRLLRPDGSNQEPSTPYEVGDIWDLEFRTRPDIVAPHVEDVLVDSGRRIGTQPDLPRFLMSRVSCWKGGLESLFDGLLRFTSNGTAYIAPEDPLPSSSVGFWLPPTNLCINRTGKVRFRCSHEGKDVWISHAGNQAAYDLPRGMLIRVSLARWWRPEDAPEREARCYLQISGWFEADAVARPQPIPEQIEEQRRAETSFGGRELELTAPPLGTHPFGHNFSETIMTPEPTKEQKQPLQRDPQYFTYYWKYQEVKGTPRDQLLRMAYGSQFQRRGVQPGDVVYIVSVRRGRVHLLGKMCVGHVLDSTDEYRRLTGEDPIPAAEYLLAATCTPANLVQLSVETAQALRFLQKRKLVPLKFHEEQVDKQSLRGVRRLSAESAATLDDHLPELQTVGGLSTEPASDGPSSN